MRLLENQVEKKNTNGFDCLKKNKKKRLAGAELSCVTGEVCASGMDAELYEIRGVSLFFIFLFLENKSGPIRLFQLPSQSEKQVEINTNKGLRPT